MPAKKIIYKENVIKAALELIRRNGENALNARALAKILNCSTQPIYSAFKNMEELENEVRQSASKVLDEYIVSEITSGRYEGNKAIGMGYVRFADEEKSLYRFLFMRKPSKQSAINVELTEKSVGFIINNNHISKTHAERFFGEIWMFCHGMASLIAAENLEFDEESVSVAMSDVSVGLSLRFKEIES